ncbi:hypothetical protein [Gracilibacillus salinarum]|uniref:Uncharacterized protein n=1 Tax=Gracilibacillus salinarum TaxID=2932255 RepID=A0ABY4GJA1_9BACI|nr:hypothetical protein [Gracilibacillus salinarum]UOQ84327.1 hypothetical protein MUN87_16765 [Gracilibacillus salinarum]
MLVKSYLANSSFTKLVTAIGFSLLILLSFNTVTEAAEHLGNAESYLGVMI